MRRFEVTASVIVFARDPNEAVEELLAHNVYEEGPHGGGVIIRLLPVSRWKVLLEEED